MSEREFDHSNENFSESEVALTDEEIDFLRYIIEFNPNQEGDIDLSIAAKTITEADWLLEHPELGMEEVESSRFLSRKLRTILGKENVGEVGGGVYGIIEGTQEDGATIFIRGDMDALQTFEGEKAHMCGHNIHMAWLIENARLLSAYKEKFGSLLFKRVVLIGEPNEEGIYSQVIGPQKMIEEGLLEKTGKPDFILGAHFAAPQPEGEVRIDPVSATYSEGRFQYQFLPNVSSGQDAAQVAYEFIYKVGREWGSEDASSMFGKGTIVENCSKATPESIIRVTNSREVGDEKRLNSNILNRRDETEITFTEPISIEEIEELVESIRTEWGVTVNLDTNDDQYVKIAVESDGGHVAQGGPNVKFVMAELLHNIREKYSFNISGGDKPIDVMGCLRTKAAGWEAKGREIGERIKQIAHEVQTELRLDIAVEGKTPVLETPPVYNDDAMRENALAVLKKAKVTVSSVGMPIAPAESFAFWESILGIPGLYISIGGGDKEELKALQVSQERVPEKYLHHTPGILDTIHTNQAIPYGAVLSLIALELGKQFSQHN